MKSQLPFGSEEKNYSSRAPGKIDFALPAFRQALTEWFRREGRNLPWRHTGDPYAILVSEIMLQQTQVATVIGYFQRWLKRFPSAEALAAAREEEVLELWQGLGYYSRARNLHKTAKALVEGHGGSFPRTLPELLALPGVGPYTAAAIATFAFDLPEPPIDGNIARVLSRLLNYREPVDSTAGMKHLRAVATSWQPEGSAGFYNEAMMELGALICTPRSPQCGICPVAAFCAAKEPETLPVKKPRRKTIPLEEHCGWTLRNGCVLLERQTGKRWNGLWKLPLLEDSAAPDLQLLTLDYPFTHHKITLRVFPAPALSANGDRAWHTPEAIATLPMTAPHRRAVENLLSSPTLL